jgi:hypothetical protein
MAVVSIEYGTEVGLVFNFAPTNSQGKKVLKT